MRFIKNNRRKMMKKYLIAALIAMMTCLAVLSGCAAVKGLERDVQVILENDGEYVGTYTVNQFNNAVVPEMEKEDLMFRGWSVLEDWTEEDGDYYLTENTGLIRYDDIKDFVVGDSLSITLYAAYAPIPERDLVIAWYDKETTSGLNQSYMDSFRTQLYAYLTSQGYSPESMDIVIRGYSGDVGTTCSEIMKDSDVDIMVGWSSTSNITNTGGLVEGEDFIENNGGITIGAKERYAARLTDTELCNLVYEWIFEEYSETGLPEDPEPATEADLVIAWYNRHTDSTDSGLTQEIMDSFATALNAYLTTQGYNPSDMQIVVRAYSGAVGDSCASILQTGDVDIMVGWSSNIDTTGGMTEGTDYIMNVGGVSIGTAERYAALLTNTELSKLVYTWIFDTYSDVTLPEIPETPVDPDPQPEPQTQLVIGWYAKSDTSGLDQMIVSVFTRGLKEYLESSGTGCDVIVRGYDGNVDDVISAVDADGDVDIMVGMKKFDYDGVMDVQNDVAMGKETGRRIHLLDDGEVSKLVYDWLKTDEARALLLTPEAQTKLVIGWYAKSGTSGLDQTIIDNFTAGLNEYLAALGYTAENLEVVVRGYDGNVDDVISAVDADGDVDIMVGMKKFDYDGVMDVQNDVPMGEKTDRRIHLLDDDALTLAVFDWLKTDDARALFTAAQEAPLAA